MCARRRLKEACASAQSDIILRCPHEEMLHPNAQADLNLRWAHMSVHVGMFSDVAALIWTVAVGKYNSSVNVTERNKPALFRTSVSGISGNKLLLCEESQSNRNSDFISLCVLCF